MIRLEKSKGLFLVSFRSFCDKNELWGKSVIEG